MVSIIDQDLQRIVTRSEGELRDCHEILAVGRAVNVNHQELAVRPEIVVGIRGIDRCGGKQRRQIDHIAIGEVVLTVMVPMAVSPSASRAW